MKLALTWLCAVLVSDGLPAVEGGKYDPLRVASATIVSKTFEVKDGKRARTLPVRVYLPESEKAAPVILFSHGLGGSKDNNPYLGNHWAKRGYVVVFIQHPGSDEGVWKDVPPARRMVDLKRAASFENLVLRGGDVPAVIDALTAWNGDPDHPLHGRLDLGHLGMSGHSFGASTTEAVAGQTFANGRISFLEPRIDAAVMMSPGIPSLGDPAKAFASIGIPCLLMTGTLDDSPVGATTAGDRLKVFPNLNHAPAWQVVFDKASHMSFGERDLKGNSEEGNRYHTAILALTTAFWDAELRQDTAAMAWLNGSGAKSVLEAQDVWQANTRAREGK